MTFTLQPDFSNAEDLVAPDAVTVNGYFGIDGVRPFIDAALTQAEGKGLFVLVRTSNESAGKMQDVVLADGRKYYEFMAAQVAEWAAESGTLGDRGYTSVGAVASARDPETAARLRAALPQSLLLVPGYGAQGLTAQDVAPFFKSDGSGALIVTGRSVIYAYEEPRYMEMYTSEWQKCIEHACRDFVSDLRSVVNFD